MPLSTVKANDEVACVSVLSEAFNGMEFFENFVYAVTTSGMFLKYSPIDLTLLSETPLSMSFGNVYNGIFHEGYIYGTTHNDSHYGVCRISVTNLTKSCSSLFCRTNPSTVRTKNFLYAFCRDDVGVIMTTIFINDLSIRDSKSVSLPSDGFERFFAFDQMLYFCTYSAIYEIDPSLSNPVIRSFNVYFDIHHSELMSLYSKLYIRKDNTVFDLEDPSNRLNVRFGKAVNFIKYANKLIAVGDTMCLTIQNSNLSVSELYVYADYAPELIRNFQVVHRDKVFSNIFETSDGVLRTSFRMCSLPNFSSEHRYPDKNAALLLLSSDKAILLSLQVLCLFTASIMQMFF